MGKKGKIGKSRKDHFYHLAKEQGFRARSAFKLCQLASKFRLFDGVLNAIDLCAAPGGWMQVVRKALPLAGSVIGVDLVPIAGLKGCVSIVADITTARCEKLLSAELDKLQVPEKKVELVLHDGAPNVGANWERDAYVQNELVLKSLELAVKYLKKGQGKFVTKVFRSADYTKLLYVFQQLFAKVQATKPQSSRTQSAEIFVVCQGFKAPARISKDFFDLNSVFEDETCCQLPLAQDSLKPNHSLQQALQGQGPTAATAAATGGLTAALKLRDKKSRAGYNPGDDFRTCTLQQFFLSSQPTQILTAFHQIVLAGAGGTMTEDSGTASSATPLDIDYILSHKETTAEILEACQDLKLCNKGILQKLLRWRTKILTDLIKEKTSAAPADVEETKTTKEVEEIDDEELDNLVTMEEKQQLKLLRKQRNKFRKLELKRKLASAVFVPDGPDEDLFGNAAESAALFNDENPYVNARELWDLDYRPTKYDPEIGGQPLCASDDENENQRDGDTEIEKNHDSDTDDYIRKLEKEMDDLHKLRKEEAILRGISKPSKKIKETRRQKKLQEWSNEMQAHLDTLETQNYKQLSQKNLEEEEEVGDEEDEGGDGEEEVDEEEEEGDRDGDAQVISDDESVSVVSSSSKGGYRAPSAAAVPVSSVSDSLEKRMFYSNEIFSGLKIPQKVLTTKKRKQPPKEGDSDSDSDVEIKELKDLPRIPLCESKRRKIQRKRMSARKQKQEAIKEKKEERLFAGLGRALGPMSRDLTVYT